MTPAPLPRPFLLPGAVAAAAPLLARRRAMTDASLPRSTRTAAAHWLRANGAPCDRAAAQELLTGPRP